MHQANLLICLTTIVFIYPIRQTLAVRVCPRKLDYYNPISTACSDNPDGGASPKEILERWNCTVNEYNLTTSDGYTYSVIEAFDGSFNSSTYPILFAHGIRMNCRGLISNGPKGIVYQLIKNGFKCFCVNFRGTIYSTENINGLTMNDYSYWNFTFHQLGTNEIPQTVEHIFNKTGKQVTLMGFSMGTTAMTIFLSLFPERAAITVKNFVALAPIVYLNDRIPSIVARFSKWWPYIQPFARALFNGKFLGNNRAQGFFCGLCPFTMLMCYLQTALVYGVDVPSIDYTQRPVFNMNIQDLISERVVTHYSQILNSERVQQFDYGERGNEIAYGQSTPPLYPLENISVPTTLVVGPNDWLATLTNVEKFYNQIPAPFRCGIVTVPNSKFTHDGFLIHKDLIELLSWPLVAITKNLQSGVCP